MRRQTMIILGVAVLFGLVAVYLTNVYLTGAERQQKAQGGETLLVAVARVPLTFGTPVTPDKVRFVSWPRDSIPAGAFNTIEQLTPVGNVHVALRPMEVGEPILKSKLSGEGGRATLSAILPADMRAVAIRISDVAGVAGFVLPGDRVDVIITRSTGQGEQQVSDVLLQNVRVIAIDQDANDNSDKPTLAKTSTLEVAQIDAQKLALAQTVGTLSLALRSTLVEEGQGGGLVQTVSVNDLRDGAYSGSYNSSAYTPAYNIPIIRRPLMRPVAKPPSTSSVEVVRGTAGSNYEVGRYVGR